jgi:hypothetical protein
MVVRWVPRSFPATVPKGRRPRRQGRRSHRPRCQYKVPGRPPTAVAVPDPSGPLSPEYPATLEITYPSELSQWLPLIKWLLAVPHYIALFFVAIGAFFVAVYVVLGPDSARPSGPGALCARRCAPGKTRYAAANCGAS